MAKKRSLLSDALIQVFIKPRGILKMSQVWLPLCLILVSGSRINPQRQVHASLFLLLAVLCQGLSAILINDLTDKEIDRRAGKERWITSFPPLAGTMIPVLLLALGFFALIQAGGDMPVFASFILPVLLGTFYSLKPIRFKDRGIWGIVDYSLSATILSVIVPWTLFRPAFLLLPLLFTVVFGDKLIQILFHQIADFDTDREENVKSFAVTIGRDKADRILRYVLKIAMVADVFLLFYILFGMQVHPLFRWLIGLVCVLGVVASGIYVNIISKEFKTSTELTERLPWTYLGLSYILFYVLPPLLLLMLALHEPGLWVLATLSTLSLLGVSANFLSYDPKK
ncbi:MAG: UbiA family prenyltransferase [Candidatus Aminicenantes bacterium]|jgi:4-hydroxybenzoate polyprenyltransferase